ncbi:hypothetical protein [Knoellia aerolata]|uniref:SseB protein N-terminal domain-containing protein n=1 Tax=Knoellia aerolata DSM 18566 TaxID=1385519 RepID=A0A0A0JYB9_9MICO|nr:hypothetical protein [Knoellia aerolata]KGN40511.1 hypothetical protein N801_13320 [Knoellia aerolata DSM 18566]
MTDAEQTASIDDLSEAVRASGGALDAQTALWGAMFSLDRWWFVARGTPPDVGPLVGTVDGVPSLLAFTSGARAREFALANGFSEEQAGLSLAVPSQRVLDMCDQIAEHGVQRVVVDQGTLGFFAPLAQLRAIHAFLP